MKIRLWSDLHLEFSNNKFKHIWSPSAEDSNVTLLLAGDIGTGMGARFFIETLSQHFRYVLLVSGNHEYYGNDMTDIRGRWKKLEESIPNFHFLDNECIILDDVRFLGGTMWTNLKHEDYTVMSSIQNTMNDYRRIKKDTHIISPQTTIDEHSLFIKFLSENLNKEFNGPTVVMTHHSPGNVQRSDYGSSMLNYAFFAEIEDLVGNYNCIDLFVHGHTHRSADYIINNTRVICNPYGYYGSDVNSDFNSNLILEV